MRMWTVAHLMTPDPYCVKPHLPVPDLVAQLVRRKITGAPVVTDSGELVGVVSLVDVAVHSQRMAPRRLTVEDIMAAPPLVIEPAAEVSEALRLFRRHRVHRLVVACQGQVVGLLSVVDVLRVVEVMAREQPPEAAPSRRTFV